MTSAVISVSQESKKAENKRILSRLKANLALAATFQEMLTENILNQQKLLEYEQSMSDKLTDITEKQMVADMEVEKVLQVYNQLKADVAATKALLADEQLVALETQLGELKLQEKKLLEEQLELASSLSVESEVATKIEEIDLIKAVTRTHFRNPDPKQPNVVSGYVEAGGKVNQFLFDTQENSATFITNSLWDLIAAD